MDANRPRRGQPQRAIPKRCVALGENRCGWPLRARREETVAMDNDISN